MRPTLDDFYDAYPRIEEAFQQALDESLGPRGPDMLYDLVAGMALPPASSVLDLGCGEGTHAIELAERFGFSVLGIILSHVTSSSPVGSWLRRRNTAPNCAPACALSRGGQRRYPQTPRAST